MPLDDNTAPEEQTDLVSWLPLFEALTPAFIELDSNDVIVRVRGTPSHLLGFDQQELVGTSFSEILHDRDRALWRLVKERLRRTRCLAPFPIRIVKTDKTVGAVDITAARRGSSLDDGLQLAISKYHGHLSLEAAKRPASSQAREFQLSNFEPLAARLVRYASDGEENPVQTLMRLAGVSGEVGSASTAQSSGAEGLWAVYKLLTDAAGEQAAKDASETKRNSHEEHRAGESRAAGVAADGQEMKAAVRSAYHQSDDTNYVTVAGDDGISESEAVKAAVYAMKQAASSERAVTMKALTGGYERRLEKVRNQLRVFKKIVVQEKFDVALQPIVDLANGDVHHFEALARFDSSFYSGSPFEFMCFAEDVGVIHEFDLAMTMKVVSLLKRVRRIGFDTNIAVNISGRSIQSPAFLRHFFRILEDCADVRHQLSFELTESSQIDDLETTNRILSRIRDFGHKVALDDFGAGAAGLQYLRVLKVDYVKIDGIYVRKALEDSENRAFLKSISDLCSGLGIETIGECIEVDMQEQFLSSIGVGYGQGWLYGKPLPVDEALTTFLAD